MIAARSAQGRRDPHGLTGALDMTGLARGHAAVGPHLDTTPMALRSEETIVAIATPLGVGGVGIVRLSGPRAVAIVDGFFRPAHGEPLAGSRSHLLRYGWVMAEGHPVDEVLAVVMRAPHSYTREDVVEVQGHGGTLVLRTVLELATRGGARMAHPGEFTLRAFLHGRIDLTQAEAVGDLVRTRSALGLQVSANQLRGRLHEAIAALQGDVQQVAALVAAGIDFPEEDVVFAHRGEITERLGHVRERLDALLARAGQGRIVREGLAVAIVGRPNVGKSSLLNALLRENRAIVTEVPGTTRDTLEEAAEVGGLMVRLVDTAGIRHTEDVVEREGIQRARRAIAQADLVLLVLDGAAPLTADDEALLAEAPPQASLVVVNKRDKLDGASPAWVGRLEGRPWLGLSALTGAGLPELEAAIRGWALQDERPVLEDALLTNLRQEQAARQAAEAVRGALAALEGGLGDELLAVDLERVLMALGEIVGATTPDDLLNRIFAEFCIGK
ncbi:MAG TPA: tRNA uridine-5-carboxymethylaminomethyl(34) synthesis GTPase MnmE [bacterium]|nr:tRNA uridine-5-carboxymethylaminomethyl(34) synthesis GTPase MnmE [bacterium]